MTTEKTSQDTRRKLMMHTRLSMVILAVGLVLMVFMIRTESEPGALPLLLIVVGTGWYLATRARIRSHHTRG